MFLRICTVIPKGPQAGFVLGAELLSVPLEGPFPLQASSVIPDPPTQVTH